MAVLSQDMLRITYPGASGEEAEEMVDMVRRNGPKSGKTVCHE